MARILYISGSDCKGGAAKVCRYLREHLDTASFTHQCRVGSKSGQENRVEEISFRNLFTHPLVGRVLHRLGLDNLCLNSAFPFLLRRQYLKGFDLVHLHDPPDFNHLALPWLSAQLPVVWTMHTMGAMTGNCLYAYDCRRWLKGCGACPQFGEFPLHWLRMDGSRAIHALKRFSYAFSNVTLIGVSNWISTQARTGMLSRFPIHTIPNPVDTKAYVPRSKSEAKQELGLSPDERVIAFSIAANPLDRRKGTDTILEAIRHLKSLGENFTYLPLSIGAGTDSLRELFEGNRVLQPRHLESDDDLCRHYSAADLIWHPSRADTSTLVGLEAMACGTPVIANAIGGPREIIQHERTGLLIENIDGEGLAQATRRLFAGEGRLEALGRGARAWVEKEHSLELFVRRHETVYKSILEQEALAIT